MATRKRILIGCPHFRDYVTGSYECDADGNYLLNHIGELDLALSQCGQCGGKCNQTLCALNRYNRKAKGSWYPTEILATNDSKPPPPPTAVKKDADLF